MGGKDKTLWHYSSRWSIQFSKQITGYSIHYTFYFCGLTAINTSHFLLPACLREISGSQKRLHLNSEIKLFSVSQVISVKWFVQVCPNVQWDHAALSKIANDCCSLCSFILSHSPFHQRKPCSVTMTPFSFCIDLLHVRLMLRPGMSNSTRQAMWCHGSMGLKQCPTT